MNQKQNRKQTINLGRRRGRTMTQTPRKVVVVAPPRRKRTRSNKPTVIGRTLRAAGSLAGAYLGAGGVGRAIGAGVSRIFGQGDYRVPARNSFYTNGVPSFSPLTSGFRLQHREYIRDISSSLGFASTTFQLNPGQSTLFPWLSAIAQNFEEYKVHGMVVYLNTTSATAVSSTNTALGIWGIVTQYDPSETDFTTKQQCENYVGCQTAVPSCSLIHGVECKPSVNVLDKFFVRAGFTPAVEDLKFYDLGKIQVFTQGSQAVSTIGEMWVSYDIEFMKPRLPTFGDNIVFSDRWSNSTGIDGSNMFGTGAGLTPVTGSNLLSSVSGNTLSLSATAPNTIYLLSIQYNSGSHTTGTITATPGGSISSNLLWFQGGVSSFYHVPTPGTLLAGRESFTIVFRKTDDTIGTLNLSGFVFGTSPVMAAVLTQVSTGLGVSLAKRNGRLDLSEIAQLRALLSKQVNKTQSETLQLPDIEEEKFQYQPMLTTTPKEESEESYIEACIDTGCKIVSIPDSPPKRLPKIIKK